ncbi:XRE family transcriptional regulator [Bergeriella denitrificans]|uniref:Putative transcriptional regulator n=1 Tax=Bergeriella denitrificans TaxID=494 RepID=A0A378UG06_BERDE|nr:S24 family peptidase [Bergeriella denitrificans]STZ76304.1 putative transcriptional regulator [Bergeriella denitrificans]
MKSLRAQADYIQSEALIRIRRLLEMKGISAETLASAMDISVKTAEGYLTGARKLDLAFLAALSSYFNLNLNWFITGIGSFQIEEAFDRDGNRFKIQDFVFIQFYKEHILDKDASEWAHDDVTYIEQPPLAFCRDWMQANISSDLDQLSVITVRGDSMEGVLNDGDNILINHAQNRPASGIYVVRIGDELIVKQTQLLPNQKLLVTSANPAYTPFEIDLTDESIDVQIIGRVEWFGRQI